MLTARRSSSQQLAGLSHLSECFLCRDVYKDPRILPCVHSFCLRCLEAHARGAKTGDSVPCPYCRREFQVPLGGLVQLPKNLYMSKLADYHTVSHRAPNSGEGGIRCTICGSRGRKTASLTGASMSGCESDAGLTSGGGKGAGGASGIRWASKYCLDCRQEMCTKCAVLHCKMKISRHHNIVELGTQMNAEKLRQGASFCPKHEDEMLKMYCFQCQKLVCLTCFAEEHSRHKCVDMKTASDIFRAQIYTDAENIKDRKLECWNALEVVKAECRKVEEDTARKEEEIRKVGAEHKMRIEMDMMAVLQKFDGTKSTTLKDLEILKQDIERRIDSIESFESFSAEISDKGSPTDIASIARQLHSQSADLHNMCKAPPIVIFLPELKSRELDKANTIGTILTNKKYVYQTIRKGDARKVPRGGLAAQKSAVPNPWTSIMLGIILIPFSAMLLLYMLF